jgi:hypothetical protein
VYAATTTTSSVAASSARAPPGWEALPPAAKEALAQFLLEQLHGYTPAAYAAYQGLCSGSTTLGACEGGVGGGATRDEAVSQDQQQQQQEEEEDQEGSPAGTIGPTPAAGSPALPHQPQPC